MKPIIFVRIADMKYYRGINGNDTPVNGGSYVKETGEAHECYNFDMAHVENKDVCLGYTQLIGSSKKAEIALHIEKIVGCEMYSKEDMICGVTVVFCSTASNSQNMRVVGFYKDAVVYRYHQEAYFENGYTQDFYFEAESKNCILLPYSVRHSESRWYVPTSHRNGAEFGFGRSSIWYAGSKTDNKNEIAYVEKMLSEIDSYDGENLMMEGFGQ